MILRRDVIKAITELMAASISGLLKWKRLTILEESYIASGVKDIFVAEVKGGFFKMTVKWDYKLTLDFVNNVHIRQYKFPDTSAIKDLFAIIHPKDYYLKDDKLIDSIIDKSIFL